MLLFGIISLAPSRKELLDQPRHMVSHVPGMFERSVYVHPSVGSLVPLNGSKRMHRALQFLTYNELQDPVQNFGPLFCFPAPSHMPSLGLTIPHLRFSSLHGTHFPGKEVRKYSYHTWNKDG